MIPLYASLRVPCTRLRSRSPRPAPPSFLFFFNDTATTEIYTLSLHDALPISPGCLPGRARDLRPRWRRAARERSEEHTSELQSPDHLVCRLLLEKKKKIAPRAYRLRMCVEGLFLILVHVVSTLFAPSYVIRDT